MSKDNLNARSLGRRAVGINNIAYVGEIVDACETYSSPKIVPTICIIEEKNIIWESEQRPRKVDK